MKCPKCSHDNTKVIDSRDTNDNKETRRRRECEKCEHRFTTFEKVETSNFVVIKKDGTRESYHRDKVARGIWRACEKRPVTQEQVNELISKLEESWSTTGKEVNATQIGEDVVESLRELDEVAYIRFASVYRQFKDVESFKKELTELLG